MEGFLLPLASSVTDCGVFQFPTRGGWVAPAPGGLPNVRILRDIYGTLHTNFPYFFKKNLPRNKPAVFEVGKINTVINFRYDIFKQFLRGVSIGVKNLSDILPL